MIECYVIACMYNGHTDTCMLCVVCVAHDSIQEIDIADIGIQIRVCCVCVCVCLYTYRNINE